MIYLPIWPALLTPLYPLPSLLHPPPMVALPIIQQWVHSKVSVLWWEGAITEVSLSLSLFLPSSCCCMLCYWFLAEWAGRELGEREGWADIAVPFFPLSLLPLPGAMWSRQGRKYGFLCCYNGTGFFLCVVRIGLVPILIWGFFFCISTFEFGPTLTLSHESTQAPSVLHIFWEVRDVGSCGSVQHAFAWLLHALPTSMDPSCQWEFGWNRFVPLYISALVLGHPNFQRGCFAAHRWHWTISCNICASSCGLLERGVASSGTPQKPELCNQIPEIFLIMHLSTCSLCRGNAEAPFWTLFIIGSSLASLRWTLTLWSDRFPLSCFPLSYCFGGRGGHERAWH